MWEHHPGDCPRVRGVLEHASRAGWVLRYVRIHDELVPSHGLPSSTICPPRPGGGGGGGGGGATLPFYPGLTAMEITRKEARMDLHVI